MADILGVSPPRVREGVTPGDLNFSVSVTERDFSFSMRDHKPHELPSEQSKGAHYGD